MNNPERFLSLTIIATDTNDFILENDKTRKWRDLCCLLYYGVMRCVITRIYCTMVECDLKKIWKYCWNVERSPTMRPTFFISAHEVFFSSNTTMPLGHIKICSPLIYLSLLESCLIGSQLLHWVHSMAVHWWRTYAKGKLLIDSGRTEKNNKPRKF